MIKRNTNVKDQQTLRRRLILVAGVLVCGGLACWGLYRGFAVLREIWREQFRVVDSAIDVVVTYSPKPEDPTEEKSKVDTIKYIFGLTNGVNLATIPYDRLRGEALAKYPEIHDILIERRLPRRVTVHAREREPAVRIVPLKSKSNSGLVADYDGVVFRNYNCPPLPVIREADESRCKRGQRLDGHARAALQLVHFLNEAADAKSDAAPELGNLRVREVDTSKKDYLLVTLGDYSTAEIAWDHMGEDSETAQQSLRRQLVHLAQAIAAHLTPRTTRWIATEYQKGGRIYAADPARLGDR